jgi:hypothetical protein
MSSQTPKFLCTTSITIRLTIIQKTNSLTNHRNQSLFIIKLQATLTLYFNYTHSFSENNIILHVLPIKCDAWIQTYNFRKVNYTMFIIISFVNELELFNQLLYYDDGPTRAFHINHLAYNNALRCNVVDNMWHFPKLEWPRHHTTSPMIWRLW